MGKKTIGGRTAAGYQLKEGGFPMTIWADVETRLPLVIDSDLELSDGAITSSMSDFAWGVHLDDTLFSLDVPEGYSIQKLAFDMSNPTEKDAIQMFQIWLSYMDGVFPSKVDMSAYFDVMKPVMAKAMRDMGLTAKDRKREPTTQEAAALQAALQEPLVKVARGILFIIIDCIIISIPSFLDPQHLHATI